MGTVNDPLTSPQHQTATRASCSSHHSQTNSELQVSEDLPKQELLIKLLKMSTSSNDGEALIAVRKANELLKSAGWDWEKLVNGKIKVIADPFASVETPMNRSIHNPPRAPNPPRPAPRPQPAPPPRPAAPQPPPPPPRPRPPMIGSTAPNKYKGWCYCCGDAVLEQQGFIFDPYNYNSSANSKWQIACQACNSRSHASIGRTAAPRQRPLGNVTPSLNDI